ncbi:hypothetical protein Taro_027006 [Colocasia esculenta]|uniref:Uncharacterized protein n=1 Tax=Colocasia esculenta TaxID=4460 RepID=A0A843VCV4_COLES|nr:hypothetical protein [Colocasia esculenta]
MLQQGSANSFELAVRRLTSLSTHQFSRTLPTQQLGRLSSLPTHVAEKQRRDLGPDPISTFV